jgi:hypothetical protein
MDGARPGPITTGQATDFFRSTELEKSGNGPTDRGDRTTYLQFTA